MFMLYYFFFLRFNYGFTFTLDFSMAVGSWPRVVIRPRLFGSSSGKARLGQGWGPSFEKNVWFVSDQIQHLPKNFTET